MTQQLGLSLGETLEAIVELAGLAAFIFPPHIEREEQADEKDDRGRRQIDRISGDIASK